MAGIELPERYNVGADLLERNLNAGRANKLAIASAGKDLTYGELFKLTCGAAQALRDLGVRREERVLIVGYDGPGWIASFLGAVQVRDCSSIRPKALAKRGVRIDAVVANTVAR